MALVRVHLANRSEHSAVLRWDRSIQKLGGASGIYERFSE